MNPLTKVRSGVGGAMGKVRGGAGSGWNRASGAVGGAWSKTRGGVGGLGAKLRGGVRNIGEGTRERGVRISDSARDGVAGLWERSGGARLMESARSNPHVATAWALAALLVFLWIAWTIYVTAEHGANAGLGVLISWPAVLAALALISAPFVGAWLLVQRLRGRQGTPAIAGGGEDPDTSAEPTAGTYPG